MENKTVTFNKKTKASEIPIDAFKFDYSGEAVFVKGDDDGNTVILTLYDGSISYHWYWGNMAFDLGGMKLAKSKIPILYAHDTDQRLGVSTKADFEGKFTLQGRLLKNSERVEAIKKDAVDGFPFEASLRFDPSKSTVRYVAEGESVEVNGHTLKGPGTVITKTTVMEGSICVFGLHNNSKTQIFEITGSENIQKKENEIMADTKQELTLQAFAAENPVLFEKIKSDAKAEGEKQARELFGQFTEKFGDDPAFVIEQFKAGATLATAVEAENAKLKKAVAEKAPEENTEKKVETKVETAEQEFSDEQKQTAENKSTDGEPATFDEAIEKRISSDNSDKSEVSKKAAATRFCVGKYPELHKKMLETQKKSG